MPYTIEQLVDPPIAVIRYEGRIHFEKDVRDIQQWVIDHEHEIKEAIHDLTHLEINFDDAVVGMGAAFKPDPSRPDSRLDVILVGMPALFKAAAQWLSQPQYGSRQVQIYDDLNEALEAVRAKLDAAS